MQHVQVLKTATTINTVFGFAIISKQNGENYVDLQGDHVTENAVLKASATFMEGSRTALDMHSGEPIGKILFGMPLVSDVAEALGVTTKSTGLVVGMRPDHPKTLAKFISGERTGFSLGGRIISSREINPSVKGVINMKHVTKADLEGQLEKLARERADKTQKTYEQSYVEILNTPQGAQIYKRLYEMGAQNAQ